MHQQVNRPSVRKRMRTERVVRRIERDRFGQTTRHYHRNQRMQHLTFSVLLVLVALSGLLLVAS